MKSLGPLISPCVRNSKRHPWSDTSPIDASGSHWLASSLLTYNTAGDAWNKLCHVFAVDDDTHERKWDRALHTTLESIPSSIFMKNICVKNTHHWYSFMLNEIARWFEWYDSVCATVGLYIHTVYTHKLLRVCIKNAWKDTQDPYLWGWA